MRNIREDAQIIIDSTIKANLPGASVVKALEAHEFTGNVYLIAIGKAAWQMTKAACDYLGGKIKKGVMITKYGHVEGPLPGIEIVEAGHPLSDENTISGTQKAIDLAESLGEGDELLFLVSGGGSALFEKPLEGISLADIIELNNQLLACGADIVEINMIRKRLSSVKAGRFAEICKPAKVFAVILSDVLGDRLDSIASGPTAPDASTNEDVAKVVEKYKLRLSELQLEYLNKETPKEVSNVEAVVTGSVRTLCEAVSEAAKSLGYSPFVLTKTLNCEAREAGRMFASIAAEIYSGDSQLKKPCAIIAGGETVVQLRGSGLGGRNQELALAAARGISGFENVVVFSLGSDGTDGPTDAAGGIVDGGTLQALKEKGLDFDKILGDNDSYHGLKAVDGLIITGPTGTNVNDVAVILCG